MGTCVKREVRSWSHGEAHKAVGYEWVGSVSSLKPCLTLQVRRRLSVWGTLGLGKSWRGGSLVGFPSLSWIFQPEDGMHIARLVDYRALNRDKSAKRV